MKNLKLVVLYVLIFAGCLSYADANSENGEWMSEINPSAKVKAMGGAGVAVKDNLSSLYINPGSMAFNPYGRMSVFYGSLNEGSHFGYMEYVYPFYATGSLGAGIEVRYKNSTNYMKVYSFGLSFRAAKSFFIGLNGRTLEKIFMDESSKGMGFNLGFHVVPVEKLNIGLKVENILAPKFEFKNSNITENYTRNIQAGISFMLKNYLNIVTDVYVENIAGENDDSISMELAYGMEICPDPALALRIGMKDNYLRLGLGIISRYINFDYAIITEYDDIVHFIQCTYKFGLAPNRKEIALAEREKNLLIKEEGLHKDTLYNEALIYLNMGEIAASNGLADEYIQKYGTDVRVQSLKREIGRWLNNVRKEKLGRSDDLKKDILKDYYQGRLDDARIKLENLKLLAPNYEGGKYLEYLLNAANYLESEKYNEAEAELIKALKINPDSKEVGALYSRLKEVIKLSEPR